VEARGSALAVLREPDPDAAAAPQLFPDCERVGVLVDAEVLLLLEVGVRQDVQRAPVEIFSSKTSCRTLGMILTSLLRPANDQFGAGHRRGVAADRAVLRRDDSGGARSGGRAGSAAGA
jgi:hypothetical protein